MNTNEEVWGSPYWSSANNTMNVRTGVSGDDDSDYEDYPPFIANKVPNIADADYPTSLYQFVENQRLSLNAEIDKSICHIGFDPQCGAPQLDITAWTYDVWTGVDPSGEPVFKIKDGADVSYMLCDNYVDRTLRTPKVATSTGTVWKNDYTLSPYGLYKRYVNWSPDADIAGTLGDTDTEGLINRNLRQATYRNWGMRTIYLVINVVYKTNRAGEEGASPTLNPTTSTRTLGSYFSQTEEWRSTRPIIGAYAVPYTRIGKTGGYSNTQTSGTAYNRGSHGVFPEFVTEYEYDGVDRLDFRLNLARDTQLGFYPLYGYIGLGVNGVSTLPASSGAASIPVFLGAKNGIRRSSENQVIWTELDGTSQGTYDYLMSACAMYGMYFADDTYSLASSGQDATRWVDPNMCLPIINDGYTNGSYTKGAYNVTNPAYEWKDIQESPYTPGRPPGPTPTTADILPSGLDWTLAGSGTNIYALNPTEIQRVWQDIFGSGIDVKQFGNQPMNAILSLKWTPFDWTYSGIQHEKPIILGVQEANPLHVYKVIETVSDAQKHMSGIVNFKFNKNFFNARYMQARLFLPFYGYYELPTAQLLSSDLQLDFYYNIPDELGVWFISYKQADSNQWVIYDYCECAIDMEVPLTGSNAAQISASRKQEALTIATQIASAAATAIVGGSTIFGIGQAARHLAQGIDAIADVGLGWGSAGLESEAYLGMRGAGTGWMAKAGTTAGAIAGGVGAAINIYNTINNAKIERAALRTNLPYHGSALQTTFLHLSMVPYVQIFKNNIMQPLSTTGNDVSVELGGNEKTDYMLKVGHACDIWSTLDNMPAQSLCQTTGIANMDTTGLELSEVQELNSILQSGFYKSI